MDVGGATQWSHDRVMSRQDMLTALGGHFGPINAIVEESSAPADRFRLPDGTVFGIISSTTDPFCRNCDRSRLTADGLWYRCLYATRGTDLRTPLRAGALGGRFARADLRVNGRACGPRRRRASRCARSHAARVSLSLKKNPHLEMHTRGG